MGADRRTLESRSSSKSVQDANGDIERTYKQRAKRPKLEECRVHIGCRRAADEPFAAIYHDEHRELSILVFIKIIDLVFPC